VQRGSEGVGVDGRVGVQLGVFGAAGGLLFDQPVGQATQGRHVHAVMGQFDIAERGGGCLDPFETVQHPGHQQPVLDRIQALRTLRMPWPHLMLSA